jgi:hypothetical protein
MDATNPLARGTNPLAEEAATLSSALTSGPLPWNPEAGDRQGRPTAGNATVTADPASAMETNGKSAPASLVAAFKQALTGSTPTSPLRSTYDPALGGGMTLNGSPAFPETGSVPLPRPESLYSQVAEVFTTPAAGGATPVSGHSDQVASTSAGGPMLAAATPTTTPPERQAPAVSPRANSVGTRVDAGPNDNTSASPAAPTATDQGNRSANLAPTPAATPTALTSDEADAVAALATRGNVPLAAFPAPTASVPVTSAVQPRSSGPGSGTTTTLTGEPRPSFAAPTATDQGNRPANLAPIPTATPTALTSDEAAVAALATRGNVPLAAFPAPTASVPVNSAVQPRSSGTGSGTTTTLIAEPLPTFAAPTGADQGSRPANLAPTPTTTPPALTSDAAAALATRGNVPLAAFPATTASVPATSAAQPRSSGTGSGTTTTLTAEPLTAFAAATGADQGNRPAPPAPALTGSAPTTSYLPPDLPVIRPRAGDLAAAQQSASTLAGAPARTLPADADPAAPVAESPGDAVLRSLAFQGAGLAVPPPAFTGPADAPSPVRPAERLAALQETIAATVSRMLVSDPLHDGGREVRIEFSADVLPDTSVRLWRHEGRLHVEFTSTAAVAEAGLRDGLPRLAEAIQRQSPQAGLPTISLRLGDSAGQPGDGRSRQRYQSDEENGDQA